MDSSVDERFLKHVSSKKGLFLTYKGLKIKKFKTKPYESKGSELSLYKNYKRNAENRGYSFDLSEEIFSTLINSQCFYCMVEPQQKYGKLIYNGIDRMDNSIGYSHQNCIACCGICNSAKSNMSLEDFSNWIMRLYKSLKPEIEAFENADYKEYQIERALRISHAGGWTGNKNKLEREDVLYFNYLEEQDRWETAKEASDRCMKERYPLVYEVGDPYYFSSICTEKDKVRNYLKQLEQIKKWDR